MIPIGEHVFLVILGPELADKTLPRPSVRRACFVIGEASIEYFECESARIAKRLFKEVTLHLSGPVTGHQKVLPCAARTSSV